MEIVFKKVHIDNLEKIMMWRTDPEISKYMYTDPEITLEDQYKWYEETVIKSQSDKYWLINVDENDVGLVYLNRIDYTNRRAYWGYYIGEENYLGKGIGGKVELNIIDYVLSDLRFNKLCCEVFIYNQKVIKLHEKYGSKIEGTLRKHIFKNGNYHDIVTMAILKEEWDSIRSNYAFHKIKVDEY